MKLNRFTFRRRKNNRNAVRSGRRRILAGSVALFAAALMPIPKAKATAYYWDVNGATAGFSTETGGWDGANAFWNTDSTGGGAGTLIAAPTNADDLLITGGTTGTITITGTGTGSSLTLSNNVATTITGGTLALGGTGTSSGLFVTSADNAATTIASAVTLNGAIPVTFQNAGTGVLSFTGGITGTQDLVLRNNGATAGGILISTVDLNNAGKVTNSGTGAGVTISSIIGSNVTEVIQNSATSSLALSAANAFGALTIKAGTVSGSGSSSAFGAGTITLGDTAANSANVTLTGFISSANIANAIVLASGTTGVITVATTNSVSAYTHSGGVTGSNSFQIAANGTQTLTFSTNTINNVGAVTNAGTGAGGAFITGGIGNNVTAINQASATSALTISTTDVIVNSGSTKTINATGAATTTISSNITGTSGGNLIFNTGTGSGLVTVSGAITTGTGSLTKNGAGSLTLTGASTFSGGVILNAGTLQLNSATGSLNSANTLTVGGTSQFIYANIGAAGASTQTLASEAFNVGDGSIIINRTVAQNVTLNLGAIAPHVTGAVGLLSIGGTGTSFTNGTTIKMTVAGQTANTIFSPGIFASVSNLAPVQPYNLAWYDTASFVREVNYGTDANTVSVTGGDILAQAGKEVRTTGSTTTTLSANANFNSLDIFKTTAADVTLGAGVTMTLGGTGTGVLLRNIGAAGTGTTTISGGTGITAGTAGGQELIIRTDGANDTINLLTPILSSTGTVTKSGLGTLSFGNTGVTGAAGSNAFTGPLYVNNGTVRAVGSNALNSSVNQNIVLGGGSTLSFFTDGDGTGSRETVIFGDNYSVAGPGTATITAARQGTGQAGGTTHLSAANKTIRLNNLTLGNNTLQITTSNGFGVEFNGTTTLSSTPTFNVSNGATASNLVTPFTLSGAVTGTTSGIIKTGTGAMNLSSTLATSLGVNDFIGDITVTGGILGVAANSSLGNAANQITLNGTTATLRGISGTEISPTILTRTINFANATQANNVIEVGNANALQLNSSFGLANNGWTKGDRGLLILNADNSGRSAATAISLGALRVTNNNALGTGLVTVSSGTTVFTAALQLSGGVTISNPITLSANGNQFGGINSGGALESVSGVNTITGAITQTSGTAALIGAAAGATLNMQGSYTAAGSNSIGFTAGLGGTINWLIPLHNNGTGIFKWGVGTFNLTKASTAVVAPITINGGTFAINDTGSIGATGAIVATAGSTLAVNDSTSNTNNRLGGRPVSLSTSTLSYTGGGVTGPWASSETVGVLTSNAGGNTVSISGGTAANNATLTFASLTNTTTSGFLNLSGVNANNRIIFTAAPTLVGGIIQRASLNGADLVTGTAATPVSAATYTALAGDINHNTLAPGGSILTTANAELSAGSHQVVVPTGSTLNAFVMHSGTAATLTGTAGDTLALTSGSLLVSGSTGNVLGNTASPANSIILAQGAVPSVIMVNSAANLELAATITTNTNIGLQKALGGSLNITGKQFFSTGTGFFDINGGTVKLSAGDHTFASGLVNIGLDPNATLDLNGSIFTANAFSSSNVSVNPNSGGTVINSGASPATLVIKGGGTFGGQITGDTSLSLAATTIFTNNQTYTGDTLITGGANAIRDFGRLSSATGNLTINYGQLHLLNDGFTAESDRINDNKDIFLSGGVIGTKGRNNSFTTETIGDVFLVQGASLIGSTNTPNNGSGEHVLTVSSLTRSGTAPAATLGFTQQFYSVAAGTGGTTADNGLGIIGNSGRIVFTTAPTLANNIVGPWAVAVGFFPNSTTAADLAEFASYTPDLGVAKLNTTGFAGYSGTALVASNSAANIRLTGTALTVTPGGSLVNTLNLANSTATAVALTFSGAGDVLNLASGGLLVQNNGVASTAATTIGTASLPGVITAGGTSPGATLLNPSDLYLYHFTQSGAALTINSKIADNPTDSTPVRLIVWGGLGSTTASTILTNGATGVNGPNNYSGGTVVSSAALTIAATANLPAGGLTLNGGQFTQTAGGVVAQQAVFLNGSSTLTLAGNNTLDRLTFDNNGGTTNPTVNAGGILTLNDATPIVLTSSNVLGVATVTGGTLSMNGAKTFSIGAATVNGEIVDPWKVDLNVASQITATGAFGITKTGTGNLQLTSTTSTFTGGVGLSGGALTIGGSSTPSVLTAFYLDTPVTSGPLGTGTLTIGGGTRILSSAAGNTVLNPITVSGNFEFDGITNLTLNGFVNLGAATRTISVNTPQMAVTMGGIISGAAGTGITKNGYGTLNLTNSNTFTGNFTLNNGTVNGTLPFSANVSTSPLGLGSVNYNGGALSLRVSTDAVFNSDINVGSTVGSVNLDVQSTIVMNTIRMGNLALPVDGSNNPTAAQVNLSGGTAANPTTLVVSATTLGLNNGATTGSRVAGQFQTFNIAANTTLAITSGGFERNNEPLNIGAGTLLLGGSNNFTDGTVITTSTAGAAPLSRTSATVYGTGGSATVTFTGTGLVYTMAPQMGAITVGPIAGATNGLGLQQTFSNVTSGSLNVAGNWGVAPGSVFNGVQPNDAATDRVLYTNSVSGLVIYNGYLNITAGGTYSFIIGSDDFSSLVIDGAEIARDITTGHGVQDTARGSITLAAGQHAITMKINVGTNQPGGGSRLLYSGPDTVATGGNAGYMAIPSAALSYFSGPANAGNNYYNAARIANGYIVASGNSVTLQGLGTDLNSTIGTLTLGGTIGATNDQGTIGVGGTGFIGVEGVTTINAGGAIVNPTTANLYLIGGINDGAALGLTKNGAGTLSLNNSTAFTGAFAINVGTVQIYEGNALSTGGNTIATGASLDLNGVASTAGRNVSINGSGTTSQSGALYNSSASAASLAGTLTLLGASTIAGYGDITVSGAITSSTLLTKALPDTLTLSSANPLMTGGLTIAAGVVNNGAVGSLGGGAGVVTVNAGAALNLSGNNTDRSITLNGTSITNQGPNQTTFGNLINSSLTASFATASPAAPGSAQLKLANTAATATISGGVTLSTATSGIGSNTYGAGGDIIITGIVSGTQIITKVGGDNLFLRGVNTFAGGPTINYGTLTLDGAGVFNGAGGAITVNEGSSFVIDNGATFTNNRVNNNVAANNRRVVLAGGTMTITGNATATNDVTELISASLTTDTPGININQGHSNINLNVASATGGFIQVTATKNGTGLDIQGSNAGTALIVGRRLGLDAAGTDGSTFLLLTNSASTAGLHIIGQNSNTAGGGNNGIVSKGISPFIIVDDLVNGANFAVVGSTTAGAVAANASIRGLGTAAGEYVAANTDVLVANSNTLITANTTTLTSFANANISINSIKITGNTLTLAQGSVMNIQSGGVLATADATIAGPGIISVDGTPVASTTSASQNLYFHTIGSTTDLTVSSNIGFAGTNSGRLGEVVKAGTGNLILSGTNFYTTNTRIQEGTLTLGSDLAIFYRQVAPASVSNTNSSNFAGPVLQINQGAILDLNGRNLTANNLQSINPAAAQGSLSGGTIINNVGGTNGVVLNATGSNTWSGNISAGLGTINFSRYGQQTFTITNENTYTGTTVIGGGATTLVDVGALRGGGNITINAATLIWNDTGSQADAYRLGASASDVTFNGGGFAYTGRQGAFSVANLGDVVINSGATQISTAASLYGNATIQMATFTRNPGAVINFAGSVLGDDGNVKVTGGVPNYNGIVGGWAITSTSNPYVTQGTSIGFGDFVQYDAATGFRAIVDYKTTATIDYSSGLDRVGFGNLAFGANANIRVNSDITMLPGNNVANSMVLGRNATTTLSYAAPGDTLFIQSGGVLGVTLNDKLIGATVAGGGKLTAGNIDGTAGPGNPSYDLYLHNLSTVMTVNAQIVNNGVNAVNLITSTGSQNGPVIRFNNTNTYTGSTIFNSTDVRLNSLVGPALANSTSISIVGGTENASDSSRQAMSRIFFEAAGPQLNSGATVNIINNATLDLNGFDQTITNLVFNNTGGHTSNSSGVGGSVRTASGTLTLTGSITATNLTNISTIPFIQGNLDLNGGQRTITVDAIAGAGTQGAAQVGLSIYADISNGGITKDGTGVLAINGINSYTGPTLVNAGTLVLAGRDHASTPGPLFAQIENSRVNVAGAAIVDLRGGNAVIGSLAGAGTVTNSIYATTVSSGSNTLSSQLPATLTIGLDNSTTGDFSGRFTNFISGINETTGYYLNITKLGTGTQTISGDNASPTSSATSNGDINNVGTLDIQNGTIIVNGANGSLGFTALNLRAGGVLTLDNSATNKANRLGGFRVTDSAVGDTANDTTTPRTISMQGGTLNFKEGTVLLNEGTAAALSMTANPGVGTVTLSAGSSVWNFDNTAPGSAGATVEVNAFTAGSGNLTLNAGGSQTLGRAVAGTGSVTVYINGGMTGQGAGTISTGAPVAAAAGLVGGNFSGVGIRPDIVGIDSTGAGVTTYDVFGLRLLSTTEYRSFAAQPVVPPWAAVVPPGVMNALVSGSTVAMTTNNTINSLRLDSGGGITSFGGNVTTSAVGNLFNPLGTLNTLTISSGEIVANSGNAGIGTATVSGGAITAGAAVLRIHANTGATFNSYAYLISTATADALATEGDGTVNLYKRVFQGSSTDAGATQVSSGNLNLLSGANTLTVVPSAAVSLADNLTVNATATVDLKGFNQTVGSLISSNAAPGGGGTLTNTVGTANFYTNASSSFGGTITNAAGTPLNLFKTGAGNLTLTSASTYTGTTNVQGGILILQDSGTLTGTTYNLNGAQLRYNNASSSLSGIANRTPVGSTWNMRTGTFLELGTPGTNTLDTVATVNAFQGYNELRVDASTGAAASLNITNLNVTAGAQVFFNTGYGNLGAALSNPNISFDNFTAGMLINNVLPWAVMDSTSDPNTATIVEYNTAINPLTGKAFGVSIPNLTAGGFTAPNFSANTFTAAVTTNNINLASATTSETATVTSRVFNSLRFSQSASATVNLAPAELVRLEAGLMITAQQGVTFNNGQITAGVTAGSGNQAFYINPTNVAIAMNSQLVDNGTGIVTLVKGGGNTLTLNPQIGTGFSTAGAAAGATTAGSTTVAIASAPTTPVAVGDAVTGAGVPNGATVTAIVDTTHFTISAPAFATTNGGTLGFGAAQVLTGTNAAVASGGAGFTTVTVTPAQALNLFVGSNVQSSGMATTITAVDTATGIVTLAGWTASGAVAANTPLAYFSLANSSTNSGYTGGTFVNSTGTLTLGGAAGARSLGGGNLTINSGGIVGMTNAGQIDPAASVTINGGGSLTFAPVTAVSPALGGINALNTITFNNNGGTAQPKVDFGTAGILTVRSGLITSSSDNQGSSPLVGNGVDRVLNFGQVSLGTSGTNQITVTDVGGFFVGQTISGAGITGTTTISSISGNTLNVVASTAGTTGAVFAVNQAPGSLSALTPTLNVTTTDLDELSADLVINAIIANSSSWTNLAGGGAALTKTGNGIIVLSGVSTFDNGFTVSDGTLVLGSATNTTTITAGVAVAPTSGPVGTGTLTMNAGTTLLSDSTARTINNNLIVAGNFTFGGRQAGNNVTINGTTSLGTGIKDITVTNPTVTATLNGVVSNTSGGLAKSGDGILVLNPTAASGNTYTGTTTVSGGMLTVSGNNGALGSNLNDLVVSAGATLNISSISPTIDGLTGGGLITSSGTAQTLTVGNNAESSATFVGSITNAANALAFTKVGAGTQNLTGLNTYAGITTINGGTLGVNTLTREPGAQAGNSSANFVSGAVPTGASGSETVTLTAADMTAFLAAGGGVGSGVQATGIAAGAIVTNINGNTLTLSAANSAAVTSVMTAQTNRITVSVTVAAQLAAGMVITGTSVPVGTSIVLVSGTTVTLSQPVVANISSASLTYATPSSVGISSNANANLVINGATLKYIGAGNTTDRGFTIGAAGATIDASGTGAIVFMSFVSPVNTIANASNQTLTLRGTNLNDNTLAEILGGSNATGLIKNDAGRWLLSAANTYTGATNVLAGTLVATDNLSLGTVAGGTVVSNGGTLELQNNITIGAEALTLNGSGATAGSGALRNQSGTNTYGGTINVFTSATINAQGGSTLNLNAAITKDGTTLTFTGGGTINVNAPIGGTSPNSDLVVDGAGTNVNLNTAATYNGPTTIQNSGKLTLGANNVLPGSPLTNMTVNTSGVFDMKQRNDSVASLSGDSTGIIKNSTVATTSTLTINGAAGSTNFGGSIQGTSAGTQGDMNIIKTGASTQVLSGASNFTGTTTVSSGTLAVTGSLSGTTAVTVNSSGTLLMNGGNNNVGTGTATAVAGTQTFTGTVGGATVLGNTSGGTLAVATGQSYTSHTFTSLTLAANTTLDFSSGGANNNNGVNLFFNTLSLGGSTLTIDHWSGLSYAGMLGNGSAADTGTFGDGGVNPDTQARLLFTTDPGFGVGSFISGINFTGFGSGATEVMFGTMYEIVPVPEPATTALLGSIALCALIGYRERRRFTGIRTRMARK